MIVALLNQKGRVGKAKLALRCTGEWARKGKRVVRVDADPPSIGSNTLASYADVAQSGRLAELDAAGPAACEIRALACEVAGVDPMTDRSPMRGFADRPSESESWVRAPEPSINRAPNAMFTVQLTIDVTPALSGWVKIAVF